MAISLLLSGNGKKGDVVMEKIGKSVFVKVALFCLVFFLVCLSSVYAHTEMKHNERLILGNIPKQQMDPASRIMVIKTTDKNCPYLLTTLDFAAYKFNGSGTQIHESFPSNLYVLTDGMIKGDIYDSMGGNLLFSYRCQFSGSKYNVESYTNGGNLVIIGRGGSA
jgi:hypothetical protein